MKKFHTDNLQEILASHFTLAGDYLENALTTVMSDLMQISSGVISGLSVSSGSVTTISISTGFIFQDGVIGELSSASGMTVSLPSSGTRTDLIVAYYQEVYDMPTSGFVLLDVSTGDEAIENNPSRRFGAAIIERLASTSYATRPSNKIPLAELTLSSSAITAIADVRIYARIQRLQADIKQKFYNMFYAGF